jgi:hypothetical protein
LELLSRWFEKVFVVIVLLLAGCASVNNTQSPAQTRENILDAQEKWLHGLELGQPIQDVALPSAPNSRYTLEIFHHGKLYQYFKGMYPGTRVLYGLYFEAGQLTALLLDQDVTDFFQCEYAYRRKSGQWLRSGMLPTSDWVKTRDLLGRDFDARVAHIDNEKMDTAEVIEAATYLPMAAIAAPIYGAYLLAGGRERDERDKRQLKETLGVLHPGTATEEDLQRLMGPPEHRSPWEHGNIWYYKQYTIQFGTSDGIVMWKESGRIETPRNTSTKFGNAECGDMHASRQ